MKSNERVFSKLSHPSIHPSIQSAASPLPLLTPHCDLFPFGSEAGIIPQSLSLASVNQRKEKNPYSTYNSLKCGGNRIIARLISHATATFISPENLSLSSPPVARDNVHGYSLKPDIPLPRLRALFHTTALYPPGEVLALAHVKDFEVVAAFHHRFHAHARNAHASADGKLAKFKQMQTYCSE